MSRHRNWIRSGAIVLAALIALTDIDRAVADSCCNKPAEDGNQTARLVANYQPTRSSRRRRGRTKYKVAKVENGGTITGVVLYKGAKPDPREIRIVKDHDTCHNRDVSVPLIRVNDDHQVAEAVVFLADVTEGKDFPKSDDKPKINQETCTFHPHVQAVRARQEVEIVNSDPVAHNINATQRIYTLFNIVQPMQGMKATQTFDKPGLVDLRCNVHDWMHAYLWVFDHPYYTVTTDNGAFRLEDVPPGKYELSIWQEHLGEQAFEVEVKAGATTKQNVELEPKEDN